ncbi:hypothetical protein KAT92_03665 [Candidatus Babeliales bacterium]|nr:hypothetical protein [Candidatus Babeliales bacterium]
MRKKVLFASLAVITCAGLMHAGHADIAAVRDFAKEDSKMQETGNVTLTKKDVDVSLRGLVREEWKGLDKINTLRASNDDQLSGFRSKTCIDLAATYGREKYGKSAADAFVRLSSYGYWQQEGKYTPFTNSDDVRDNKTLNLLTYVEEAWFDLHFGTFFDAYDNWYSFKDHPTSIKMGYFPHQVGRGISFGDFPMHLPYLGFPSYERDSTRYTHPGILLHGNITKDIAYGLYYSKQAENGISTSQTWETIHANRTDRAGNDFRRRWRGVSKDREFWSANLDLTHDRDWGNLLIQPYGTYLDAPETHIEFEADSAVRLGTVGMMAEYKKGGFAINAEVAGQFGHQNVWGIDRNRTYEDTSLGVKGFDSTKTYTYYENYKVQKYTHVFEGSGHSGTNAIVGRNDNPNNLANKGGYDSSGVWINPVTKNGDQILAASNTIVDDSSEKYSKYNSDVVGNARFRDQYRIDYRGFMGVVDMKYAFEEVPVVISAAGGYISGDKYPYNTEQNKRYKAFIPYGDFNYAGKYVKSHIVMEERSLPRPVDLSYRYQYAFNNDADLSNLAYLGTGVQWRPFEDKEKLLFESNIMWFWEATAVKKWDKAKKMPAAFKAGGWHTCGGELTDYWAINNADGCCKQVGWKSDDTASRALGTELNFEVQYRPVDNCMFLVQLACFLPGQLYKDLDGQPNVNTKDSPVAHTGVFGLGNDPVWRGIVSFNFKF